MKDISFVVIYMFSDTRYYERLSRARSTRVYVDLLGSLVPPDWPTFRSEIWIEAKPPKAHGRSQGFKIHLSASLEDAEATINIAVPILIERCTPFKVIADPSLHRFANSKLFPRGSSGKFITIYPSSQEMFIELTSELALATKGLSGPYILSDRRYGDSGVVYYRYGGFRNISVLSVDGTRKPVITGIDGRTFSDKRVPFFKLPEGIKDPFDDQLRVTTTEKVLHARYRVEEALAFSNVGGVYRATDLRTNLPVVIKEARPHTVIIGGPNLALEATAVLEHQRQMLQALQFVPCVPRLLDSFVEWEHNFLVESFIDGVPLATLRAQESFLIMGHMYEPQALSKSCNVWKDIGIRLLDAVQSVHERGVLMGDISPLNVMRNGDTGELTLVDHESACMAEETGEAALFNASWGLPGFRMAPAGTAKGLSKAGDYFACGMVLYSLICPIQSLFDLDRSLQKDSFLKHFCEAGLPIQMADIIRMLWDGDASGAMAALQSFSPDDCIAKRIPTNFPIAGEESQHLSRKHSALDAIKNSVKDLVQTIIASADFSREDRLWPSHALVFETNPLSLAYGACGTALFIKEVLGAIPEDVCDWIRARKITAEDYPPGLYTGISGIAWTFALFGWTTSAKEVMRLVEQSPLAFESPTLFEGVAGWGFGALALFLVTQDDEFLTIADRAGTYLLESKQAVNEGWFWKSNEDASTRLGVGYGSAGIALFLLQLWRATQYSCYLHAAEAAIDFEIAHGRERNDGALVWAYSLDSRIYSPYWLRGSGGIASVLARFYQVLADDRYLNLARKAAQSCADFFSAAPNAFEGLASMGETLLDMYDVTRDESYYSAAVLKAEQILLYRLKTQNGTAFPGQWLFRISHDYGTGGAGIGMFLQRILTRAHRKFHDLPFVESEVHSSAAD